MRITPQDIKDWSGVIAAVIAALSALYMFFLVKTKEWNFEKERQAFATKERLAKEQADRDLAEANREFQEDLKRSSDRETKKLQEQKLEHEVWKQVLGERIQERISAVKALRTAVGQLFDSFEKLLSDAQSKDDHEILEPLSQCIAALSDVDRAVKAASKISQGQLEKARLNRLKVMKRFFLGVLLDLTRRKSERSAQRSLFLKLTQRLSKRRTVAERHIDIVLNAVSTPPSDA